jgi:DNA polymerase-3 subunit delta
MGELTADTLFRQITKGAIDPVYYLHGDEDILKDEAVRAIADRVLDAAMRAFNLDQPDTAGLDAERLHALLNTPPMLAERRVVVLRAVKDLQRKPRVREALLRYLAAPSADTVLVMVDPAPDPAREKSTGKDLAADFPPTVSRVTMDRLPPERVLRWIAHRAGPLGITLDEAAATHLAGALDHELGPIAQELEKLAVAVSGRPVTRADVEGLIGIRHGETLQDFVAAALERRAGVAARLVGPVLARSGVSGVRMVTALGTALLGTAIARAELDRGTPPARAEHGVFRQIMASRPMGLPQWKAAAAQWVRWARGWRAAELRRALRAALAADRALKGTGVSGEAGIVTELVLSWAIPAREAA